MKKSILLFAMAALMFASCTKTGVAPSAKSPVADNLGASFKAKPVSPAPGGGGGGTAAPVTNLDIFTKQLTAGWLATLTTSESVPNIPNALGTITLIITLKSNGTFTLASTDNVSGAKVSNSGTWKFTIPAGLPLHESGLLVLTSGATTLMSGYVLFVRPGILSCQTSINNLDKTINLPTYIFQKN